MSKVGFKKKKEITCAGEASRKIWGILHFFHTDKQILSQIIYSRSWSPLNPQLLMTAVIKQYIITVLFVF